MAFLGRRRNALHVTIDVDVMRQSLITDFWKVVDFGGFGKKWSGVVGGGRGGGGGGWGGVIGVILYSRSLERELEGGGGGGGGG